MIRVVRRLALSTLLFCGAYSQAQVNVTTYHNDNARTGQNTQETILTPVNVNSTQFGKLFTVAVDGKVMAQPLYLSDVAIGGGTHNVLYVATEHDSVYAIDADLGVVYWQVSLIPAGGTTVNSVADLGCTDLVPEYGITGTPVIDASTNTLYVVAKSKRNGGYFQFLHAIDAVTGAEKFGGPTQIQASVAGTAIDGNGRTVTFNPFSQNQRAALLLDNGHIVISWASHCDNSPWHGWVMSYGAGSLAQEAVFNVAPNGNFGGVWMSGAGPAADAGGNIFFATGNGTWNGTTDFGDSIVKLGLPAGGSFPVLDYFTPWNQNNLAENDSDVASAGVLLLPPLASGRQLLALMAKTGTIYVLDRNGMGQYCPNAVPACNGRDTQIVQEITNATPGVWGSPAYWNGSIYWGGANDGNGIPDNMKAFSFNAGNSGVLSTAPTSKTPQSFYFSAPVPSVSANGATGGIVWGMDDSSWGYTCSNGSKCQVLYAYDATNLANMLYNSNQAPGDRDVPGGAVKFATPTIANGKVYAGGQYEVSAFGLLGNVSNAASPVLTPAAGTFSTGQIVALTDATPGAVIQYTINGTTPTTTSPVYSAPIAVNATTTVRAIANATGYAQSGITSGTYTITNGSAATPVAASLAVAANVAAVGTNGAPVPNGGIDGSGDAYSASLLGTTVTWSGASFTLAGPGVTGAASEATIALPAGNYSNLLLLATGVHGAQLNQTFVVTYTDGTTTTITQSLSDWFAPQGYSGESVVAAMPYRLTSSGAGDARTFNLYGYSFAINSAKTVQSITLPQNRDVVVLAVDLTPGTAGGSGGIGGSGTGSGGTGGSGGGSGSSAPVNVTLKSAADVVAVGTNGTPVPNGGIDGSGDAYSATLLGTAVTWSGNSFTVAGPGSAGAVSEATIALPAGNYSNLLLLATALHGAQVNQTFVVTYTDGTTTTITQSLSDWFTPQGYTGESVVSAMPYRLISTGAQDTRTFNLYGYSFAINSAKTVKSLTLPHNRAVVVLAIDLTPGSATTGTGGGGSGGGGAASAASVSLTAAANVVASGTVGTPVPDGGLDGSGDAYAGNLLGTALTWSGAAFTLAGPGAEGAVSKSTIALPGGNYSHLLLLATGVHGNQTNQTFVVTYGDGSTSTFTQSLSDWFTPQGYNGESSVLAMAHRLTGSAASSNGPFYLSGYSFAINNAKTVQSIALPANRNVIVLAVTLTP